MRRMNFIRNVIDPFVKLQVSALKRKYLIKLNRFLADIVWTVNNESKYILNTQTLETQQIENYL